VVGGVEGAAGATADVVGEPLVDIVRCVLNDRRVKCDCGDVGDGEA
jgi:hypothetical protein